MAISSKPVEQKLKRKPGRRFVALHAPAEVTPLLGDDVETVLPAVPADIVVLFVTEKAALEAELPDAIGATAPGGILWVAYPKMTRDTAPDLYRDSIREHAETVGWHAVAIIAVDDVWSALRLRKAA
jgi:hypothetical protein